MRLPPLEGTDDDRNYIVTDSEGNRAKPIAAIVPIFAVEKNPPRHFRLLGTGFFIAQNLVVTARHVFEGIYEKANEHIFENQIYDPYIIHSVGEMKAVLRPILSTSISTKSDIIVAKVRPSENIKNKCLPLKRDKPRVDDLVFTFAYPNSKIVENAGKQNVYLEPSYYRGSVVEYFPKYRDKSYLKWPCFQVNFHLHPGASGGPVFDRDGRVFGVNCASMEPYRDTAFVTSIDSIKDATIHEASFEDEFYPELPLRKLIRSGVIRFF